VYVCIYVYTYVYMHMYVNVCMYKWMDTRVFADVTQVFIVRLWSYGL
jgi:hypothetical protein